VVQCSSQSKLDCACTPSGKPFNLLSSQYVGLFSTFRMDNDLNRSMKLSVKYTEIRRARCVYLHWTRPRNPGTEHRMKMPGLLTSAPQNCANHSMIYSFQIRPSIAGAHSQSQSHYCLVYPGLQESVLVVDACCVMLGSIKLLWLVTDRYLTLIINHCTVPLA
jgi:hypothetical protein